MVEPIITEEYWQFAAGRGKRAIFAIKGSIPKQKKSKKRNPNRFCLDFIKSNPNSIQFSIYRGKRQITIYPEKRRLSKEEMVRLWASLTAFIMSVPQIGPKNTAFLHLSTKYGSKVSKKKPNLKRLYLKKELADELQDQYKRLQNWLNKKPKK